MAYSHPSSLSYSCCCLLFLSFSLLASSPVHGRDVGKWHEVSVHSMLPSTVCSSSKASSDASMMEIVHRHGPCTPMSRHQNLSHAQILDQDQSRVDSIHHGSSAKPDKTRDSLAASIPAHKGVSLGTGNYVVTVGLGTPQKQFSVIFDTGSDVTWIQCKPCVSCYQQQDPLFDPTQSSTYRDIPCSSQSCSLLDLPDCSPASTCRYTVTYGDNSQTKGFFVEDTLTLTPSDVLPNFLFGCGDQNAGLFGQTAGLIGLGRDQLSLVSQSVAKYGGVFSYCLPSISSATGYLKLGAGAPSNVQFTPMLTYSSLSTFYFLNMVSMTVGGQKLPIPSTIFSNAGIILDSGTVITRLPFTAYSALRSAFRRKMTSYPMAPALSILDTCYDFSNYRTVTVPTVGFQYSNGVSVTLDFDGIMYPASISQVCLGFASNSDDSDVGIIGNVQQRKFSVVYDVPNRKIGFGASGCS